MPTFVEIWNAVHKDGLAVTIAILSIFLGAYAIYVKIKRWADSPLERAKRKQKDTEAAEEAEHKEYALLFADLLRHPFFPSMRYAIKYRIPHLDISEPCRRLIFRDLLIIKFTVFLDNIQHFINKGDLNEMTVDHFHEAIMTVVSCSVSDYEQKMRETGIPAIVIDRFGYWHQNTVDLIMELIDNASNSRFYHDNNTRMVAILDWLQAAFQITLLDGEKTLTSLNGELDGITYKGVKAHCKSHNKCDPCELEVAQHPKKEA